MPKINVYNTSKEVVSELELDETIFGVDYNEALIHEAVVATLANARQGTQSALTRAEVRGHAKKPWRQKGTGRARHSSTKSPIWEGGGVAFAPKPRDYSKKMNKKAKALAFLSAISAKVKDEDIIVLDKFDLKDGKTKEMAQILKTFEVAGRNAIVLNSADELVFRASNNIPMLSVLNVELLGTYDVVANKKLIMTLDAIKELEEAFK